MSPAQHTNTVGVGLRSERGPILGALMLAAALVALDATILATASTTIARELGAFDQVPWLFSSYTLAQAVTVPVYGRLADVLGRKRVMLAGIGLFLLGSVLCALAPSMLALIVFRVIQGLGAGAIIPMSMTIASDIYTLAERAKTQGYLASVWAISSVAGPTFGGVFAEFVSWRWIFWINVPFALAAAVLLWRRFREPGRSGPREPIDVRGAVLLTLGSALLVLVLLEAGTWGWDSPLTIGLFVAALLLLLSFVLYARRAAHPIFNVRVLRQRIIGASTVASLMVGVIVLGLSTYVPIYAQGVLGYGPLMAGFALAALTLGWPIAATLSGRVYLRFGFRFTGLLGSGIVVGGATLTLMLGESSQLWQVGACCFVIGVGMGLTATPTLIAAQTSADWGQRGAVTGTNLFARSLGSAAGVAVFGGLVNARTTLGVDGLPEGPGLAAAMHLVFIAALVVTVVMLAAVAVMPKDRPTWAVKD
ncbi:MDR family MFS transporter [Ruania halotolerans]|uniref:MDR family MFS transporter n=1 Tax=Ruania halotolerans TaxID=2897773 RepID=UPI001E28A604|nr:MDR family MFS transporter [Ruania halotolerans]UFU06456.1 MFS transporter [Ruania halotolerans]